MTLTSLDWLVIALYFVSLALFGLLIRRKQTFAEYSVALRAAPTTIIWASLSATYIGPGFTMGLVGRSAEHGLIFFFLFALFSLQTLAVGFFLAGRLNSFQGAYTIGDVLKECFGRPPQLAAGIISLGLCAGFAAVMGRAGGAILSTLLDIPLWLAIGIITGVGLLYTFTGGLKAVMATEALQFAIIILAIGGLAFFGRLQVADLMALEVDAAARSSAWLSEMSVAGLVGLALSFLLGEVLIPPYANRALAAASPTISRVGFLMAGGFSLAWFATVSAIGIASTAILPTDTPEDSVFVGMVAAVLPHGFVGLVLVAIAAVVMSSQESVLNAGAVVATRDLVEAWRPLTPITRIRAARLATLALGITAYFLALKAPSIVAGLLVCYAVWSPSVLPVFVWAIFRQRSSPLVAFSWMLGGALGSLASILVGGTSADSGVAIFWGLAGAVSAAVITSLLRRIVK